MTTPRQIAFWLPYTRGNSGSDVSIEALARALVALGHVAVPEAFAHACQYAPWVLAARRPPPGTEVVIGNSWNAFAFHRPPMPLITVERLFVLDPALAPHRSLAQAAFHHSLVRHGLARSYRASDLVIALSRSSAASMQATFPWVRPTVIPNAVDVAFFSPGPPRAPLAGRPVRLLFAGNLSRRKGVDLLAPILDALGGDAVLDCATGRDSVAALPAHPRIRSLGRLTLEGMRAAYRDADLLLLPSRLEGMPRVAMEALACGTPVVSSDASSLPEVVLHGATGFTCPVEDVAGYAAAVREATGDQARYDALARAARRHAERRHDLRPMAAAYAAHAADLLARGPAC